MCSRLTDEEIDQLRRVLFPLDENGDVSFNVRNLELALKSVKVNVSEGDLNKIINELEKETDSEAMLRKVLEVVEEKRIGTRRDLDHIKNNAISSLRSLIELLGHILSADEMEEIIAEGEKGDIDIEKILSILEKQQIIDDSTKTEYDDALETTQSLRRRMICLGIISRALGKSMTEDDLIDMLSDEDEWKDQAGTVNYSRLLTMMEHKMKELCHPEQPQEHQGFPRFEEGYQISLSEIRSVMSTLGSVMINMGQTFTDNDFKEIIENDWTSADSAFPRVIVKLMEKEIGPNQDDADVLKEFRVFDRRGTGFVTVEDLRQALTKPPDPFTDAEVDEFLKDAEINERGEFNYHDYVAKMTQKNKL